MAFSGYFDQQMRQHLFANWCNHLHQAMIQFRQDLARTEVSSDTASAIEFYSFRRLLLSFVNLKHLSQVFFKIKDFIPYKESLSSSVINVLFICCFIIFWGVGGVALFFFPPTFEFLIIFFKIFISIFLLWIWGNFFLVLYFRVF